MKHLVFPGQISTNFGHTYPLVRGCRQGYGGIIPCLLLRKRGLRGCVKGPRRIRLEPEQLHPVFQEAVNFAASHNRDDQCNLVDSCNFRLRGEATSGIAPQYVFAELSE